MLAQLGEHDAPAPAPAAEPVKPSGPEAAGTKPIDAEADNFREKAEVALALKDAEKPAIQLEKKHQEEQLGVAEAENFATIQENPFESAARQPLSTFSIDVDTASYANVRRFLNQHGQRPPKPTRCGSRSF